MIGLSISFCISDIIRGEVYLRDVECIVAGTKMRTEEDVDRVIDQYKEHYWYDYPEEAEKVFRQLWDAGKVYQPRLSDNGNAINIASGHWV